MSALLFTPPPTKSNAVKKACCCDWGDKCSEFKAFFDKNKRELGKVVEVRYADTCNFLNFYNAAVNLLNIPQSQRKEWKKQYDDHIADKKSKIDPPRNCPRITIAKFHFPIILALTTTQWTSPLTRDKIEELECYINRSPPPQQDSLLIYNPDLGPGQSKKAKKLFGSNKLFRVAPCASKADVTAIAAKIQREGSTNQPLSLASTKTNQREVGVVGSIVKCRHEYNVKTARIQLELEEEEMKQRTPEQWKDVVSRMKSENDDKLQAKEAEVESLLEQLRLKDDEIAQLKGGVEKHRKRTRRTQSALNEEAADDLIEGYCKVVWEKFLVLISNAGGISRLTIFNDEWHANHSDAARLLWGYNSWKETKLYVNVFFKGEVDVNYDPSANIRSSKEGDLIIPALTAFERCMACRMFFHVFAHEQIIALCFDRHRTRIGQISKEWAPKWADVGVDLSCLDITSNYLFKEVPDRNINLGKPRLVFVDGKDWLISPKRNDTTVEKMSFSSKTDSTSTRGLTFSTAGGLVFEWSPLFGGRGGERKIIEFMGSLGPSNAPIADWEDVAYLPLVMKADEDDDIFWTALSDVMTAKEFDETIERLEEGDLLVSNGLLDDGILITGQPTGLAREGLEQDDADNDTDEEGDEPMPEANECQEGDEPMPEANEEKSARHIFGIDDALDAYDMMVKAKLVETAQRESGSDKRPPILTPDILKEQNYKALRNDPNKSGRRKLRQLERLQELHLLYEKAKLKRCLLSYFLLVTEEQRLKLLSWMGSKLASHIKKPSLGELNNVPLRLAKIPEEYGIGGDKGFSGIEYSLPNCNEVDTPPQVANSKKERLSKEQIESEIPLTSVRAPCETVFKRVDSQAVMKEKVPYWIIPWLPHGHALAHGEANLCRPLRYPGRNAIVGDDYWDDNKDYTRIQQQSRTERNVTTSARRECRKCKQGGIVEFCSSCSKWYHSDCHNFGSCDPGPVVNPYM